MIRVIKRIGFAGISTLNIEWLKKRSPLEVVSPFHHLVSDEPVPYIEKLYAFKNSAQFEADLDFFLRHFHPFTLEEIIQHIRTGRPFDKKGFLICFDDGLRQVYETAAPILLRKGVPAALFLNSAFVDNKDIFYNFKKGLILDKFDRSNVSNNLLQEAARVLAQNTDAITQFQTGTIPQLRSAIRSINYLNRRLVDELGPLFGIDFEEFRLRQRPFMTTPEIKELIAKGFAIGSHSIDHPLYALLPLDEQVRQTRESTDWVIKTFGLPYKTFAFPHIDTGVGHAFFQHFVDPAAPQMDLLLGNSTGMLERNPRVLHRFIGENPYIPIDRMVKSVLAYSAIRKQLGGGYVQRG
jgi:peptidoglycan/xylan/chitin deacetylase (PgdA/CDA1 family)